MSNASAGQGCEGVDDFEIPKMLVEAHADVRVKDNSGKSPLDAAKETNSEALKKLFEELRFWLQQVGLEHKEKAAQQWCANKQAASVNDIRDFPEDFGCDLNLTIPERRRVQQEKEAFERAKDAAAEKKMKTEKWARFIEENKAEANEYERGYGAKVCLDTDRNQTNQAGLRFWLQELGLEHKEEELRFWLQQVGLEHKEEEIADFAAALACSNVDALVLLNCGLNDQGAAALAAGGLSQFRYLDLMNNKIGDSGVEALAKHEWPQLRYLTLSNNRIGDRGAAALATCPHLYNLVRLDLHGNNIGDEGAVALAACDMPRLHFLDLRVNDIRDRGADALAKAQFSKLEFLGLTGNHAISSEGKSALRQKFGDKVRCLD